MGVDVLRGIFRTVDDLPRVKAALDVKTVRDVALYPPYIAALIILSQIHPVLADNGVDDPDAPAELQPKVCDCFGNWVALQVATMRSRSTLSKCTSC